MLGLKGLKYGKVFCNGASADIFTHNKRSNDKAIGGFGQGSLVVILQSCEPQTWIQVTFVTKSSPQVFLRIQCWKKTNLITEVN